MNIEIRSEVFYLHLESDYNFDTIDEDEFAEALHAFVLDYLEEDLS